MVDCGEIDVTNGHLDPVNDTTYPVNVTFICDPGYDLVGDQTRECQSNGRWTGTSSTCEPKGTFCNKQMFYFYITLFMGISGGKMTNTIRYAQYNSDIVFIV